MQEDGICDDYGAAASYYDVNDWKLSDEALHDLEPFLLDEGVWSADQENSYSALTYEASDYDLPLQNLDNLALEDGPCDGEWLLKQLNFKGFLPVFLHFLEGSKTNM